ncbi:pyridoxamine 5'-phosphate oxidase family protein [Embleya scabrispora]|uniref:pyridoxamine 5'-phosphate oxidase family protein n=1 Tax=Embleya scabrispora TaxID=159449 RepID=UPI00035FE8C4|nr:pyridoxamine 5'-phosphate oxidase family protein [Embleya scabrispora]MYS85611.1 pyridoxamine 5'-phosphate oxidase family protein [Streptomyces sp. SID5474]
MTPPPSPPRTAEQRKQDTLDRLEHDVDAWVATADAKTGTPYLVPLSFLWDGSTLLIATASASPTARNLLAGGTLRLGIGPTRDVVMIEATAEPLTTTEIPGDAADDFAATTGFDPRTLTTSYHYFRIRPNLVQAWREANEIEGREVLRDGTWLVP